MADTERFWAYFRFDEDCFSRAPFWCEWWVGKALERFDGKKVVKVWTALDSRRHRSGRGVRDIAKRFTEFFAQTDPMPLSASTTVSDGSSPDTIFPSMGSSIGLINGRSEARFTTDTGVPWGLCVELFFESCTRLQADSALLDVNQYPRLDETLASGIPTKVLGRVVTESSNNPDVLEHAFETPYGTRIAQAVRGDKPRFLSEVL
jgi:hypothetical protein